MALLSIVVSIVLHSQRIEEIDFASHSVVKNVISRFDWVSTKETANKNGTNKNITQILVVKVKQVQK
jgi:hypothetical protein